MEIRYVNYAIANNFGDYIELNENLQKYPRLHKAILNHELGHTRKKGFTRKDLMHDINEDKVNQVELFKFMLANPKSLVQFLPFYPKDKTIYYDLNLMLFYGILFSAIGLTLYFTLK